MADEALDQTTTNELFKKFSSVFQSVNDSLIRNNELLSEISAASVEEKKIENDTLNALNSLVDIQKESLAAFNATQEALKRAALLADPSSDTSDGGDSQDDRPQAQASTRAASGGGGILDLLSNGFGLGAGIAGGAGLLGLLGGGLGTILGLGARGAIGALLGNFIQGAVEEGLNGLDVDPTIAAGVGDALKDATIWGAIGSLFGRRMAVIAAAGGLLSNALEGILDQNEDGIIAAFGQEFDAATVASIGGLLGAFVGQAVLGRAASAVLGGSAGAARASALAARNAPLPRDPATGRFLPRSAARNAPLPRDPATGRFLPRSAAGASAATGVGLGTLALGGAAITGAGVLDAIQRQRREENIAEFEAAAEAGDLSAGAVAQEEDISFFRRAALSLGLATPETVTEQLDDLRRTTTAAAGSMVTGGADALTGERVVTDTETRTALRNTLVNFIGDTDLNTLSDTNLQDIEAIARQISMPEIVRQIDVIQAARAEGTTPTAIEAPIQQEVPLSQFLEESQPITPSFNPIESRLGINTERLSQDSTAMSTAPAPVVVRGGDSINAPSNVNNDNRQITTVNKFVEPSHRLNHIAQ